MGRTDGRIGGGIKNARVVFLVHDTSAQCHACTCIVSSIYSIQFRSYGPEREDNSKTKNARVVFLVHDTSSQCDACTGKVS